MKAKILFFCLFLCSCSFQQARDWYKRATELSSKKDIASWEEAIKEYNKIIDLKIKAYERTHLLHRKIAKELMERGFWKEAAKHLQEAIKLCPTEYLNHYFLGICYANIGKVEPIFLDEAIKQYTTSLTLKPSHPQSYYGLGMVYFYGKREREKGIECMKKAISYDNAYREAHVALAQFYYESGKYKEAIQSYKSAISLYPKKSKAVADYYTNIGVIYKEMGMKEEAIENLKEAIRISPMHPDALKHLRSMDVEVYDRLKRVR